MKSKILLLLVSILYLYIMFNRSFVFEEKGKGITWDRAGYYVYLPAVFIYHDLGQLAFYKDINRDYNLTLEKGIYYGCYYQDATGKRLNKYPIGTALAQLPFFGLGHALTVMTAHYPPDGFSYYYQLAVYLSSIFWSLMGLVALRQLLMRYFTDDTTLWVLLILALGTNLYFYTVFDAGMSHAYSFAFFALTLHYTDLYFTKGQRKHLLLAALFMAWIIITRPTNGLLVILLLFRGFARLRETMAHTRFTRNLSHLLPALSIFAAVLLIQMSYWKYTTGSWVYYAYQEEGFNFSNPHIWDGLFSYRKGWFVYTPLSIMGIIGMVPLLKQYPRYLPGIFIFLVLNIYLVFSWTSWFYGGSFGCRALVESLAVLAIPIAALLHRVSSLHPPYKFAVFTIIILLCALNMWQSYQYSVDMIPTDNNTRDNYWYVFFKLPS